VKFLLDHDVPDDLTYLLQQLGHEVSRLRDVLQQEVEDLVVFQFAQEPGCLLSDTRPRSKTAVPVLVTPKRPDQTARVKAARFSFD
jgi:hypothetical protein